MLAGAIGPFAGAAFVVDAPTVSGNLVLAAASNP
jgi:hypothetical protein